MNNILQEKYRPNNMDEIIGQEKNIVLIKKIINEKKMSNMIFYGPWGTGKTWTALNVAKI